MSLCARISYVITNTCLHLFIDSNSSCKNRTRADRNFNLLIFASAKVKCKVRTHTHGPISSILNVWMCVRLLFVLKTLCDWLYVSLPQRQNAHINLMSRWRIHMHRQVSNGRQSSRSNLVVKPVWGYYSSNFNTSYLDQSSSEANHKLIVNVY